MAFFRWLENQVGNICLVVCSEDSLGAEWAIPWRRISSTRVLFGGGEPLLKAVVKLREQGMLVRRPLAALGNEFLQGRLIVFLRGQLAGGRHHRQPQPVDDGRQVHVHDRVEEVRGLLVEEHFHLRLGDFLLFQQIVDLDRRDAGIAGEDGAIPPAVGRLDPVGRIGLSKLSYRILRIKMVRPVLYSLSLAWAPGDLVMSVSSTAQMTAPANSLLNSLVSDRLA